MGQLRPREGKPFVRFPEVSQLLLTKELIIQLFNYILFLKFILAYAMKAFKVSIPLAPVIAPLGSEPGVVFGHRDVY
jgi:hypothetical protein